MRELEQHRAFFLRAVAELFRRFEQALKRAAQQRRVEEFRRVDDLRAVPRISQKIDEKRFEVALDVVRPKRVPARFRRELLAEGAVRKARQRGDGERQVGDAVVGVEIPQEKFLLALRLRPRIFLAWAASLQPVFSAELGGKRAAFHLRDDDAENFVKKQEVDFPAHAAEVRRARVFEVDENRPLVGKFFADAAQKLFFRRRARPVRDEIFRIDFCHFFCFPMPEKRNSKRFRAATLFSRRSRGDGLEKKIIDARFGSLFMKKNAQEEWKNLTGWARKFLLRAHSVWRDLRKKAQRICNSRRFLHHLLF